MAKDADQTNAILSGRRRWLALTGLGALLCVAAVLVVVRPFDTGTLQLGVSGTRSAYPNHLGAKVVWGYNFAENLGNESIRLLGVELLPKAGDHRVEVVDLRVELVNDGGGGLGVGPWPYENVSNRTTKPLEGFTVRPGDEVEIYVIVVARKPGRTDWDTIRVSYEQGGREHATEANNGFTVCAPKSRECDTSVDPAAG